MTEPVPRHRLISILLDPRGATRLDAGELNLVMLQARRAGVLARLGDALDDAGLLDRVPRKARDHFRAARIAVRSSQTAVRFEVNRVRRALVDADTPIVLLKGAAYMMAGLPPARARLIGDLDVMVPRERIETVERMLLDRGWKTPVQDDYDDRYYREWSHEIPPLMHPDRETAVDVHHTIAPLTSRLRPDASALIAASLPLAIAPLRVLAPADMVLHSTIHLFNDEVGKPLRDLFDLHDLLCHFGQQAEFWRELVERAKFLGLGRPLYYMLHQARTLLGTPVPAETIAAADELGPGSLGATLMESAFRRYFLPEPPEGRASVATVAARHFLYLRTHWLRMPPGLLARHLAVKAARRTRERFARQPAADA